MGCVAGSSQQSPGSLSSWVFNAIDSDPLIMPAIPNRVFILFWVEVKSGVVDCTPHSPPGNWSHFPGSLPLLTKAAHSNIRYFARGVI